MSLKGKKVLVTGAGGFIGSHLTERLIDSGADVKAMVHYNALGRNGWLDYSAVKGEMEIFAGDITDRDSVKKALVDREIVYHLAALIAIPYSYHAPASYVMTNVMGTLNVLQVAKDLELEKVITTSTSEVYGTAQYVPIDEKHPVQGQSPYSASKIGADKLAEAFYLSYELPIVVVRPFNAFGPRQSSRAIIPTIITQVLKGEEVKLGNLSPTRDLNYVSNIVDGFVAAGINNNAVGRVINFGFGEEISIGDLAKLIFELVGKEFQIQIDHDRIRPIGSEVERLLASNQLAKDLLDWAPKVGLKEGLSNTISWVQENMDKFQTEGYTV